MIVWCPLLYGTLHTGTETGFTGSESLIRTLCGLAWAPRRLRTLHCWTHCPGALSRSIAGSSDPNRGHVEAKWFWILDLHRIQIQGTMWRAPMSKIRSWFLYVFIFKVESCFSSFSTNWFVKHVFWFDHLIRNFLSNQQFDCCFENISAN